MAAVRKLPECGELVRLAESGMSNRQIGEQFGVSGEAVRQGLERCGYQRDNRPGHGYYIPWRVRSDHQDDTLIRRLRDYSKRQQGKPLAESKSRLLDEWVKWMQGGNPLGVPLSVHYDRTDDEGFWLEPAQAGDRDFIHPPEAA